MNENINGVRPGQLWEDNDKRCRVPRRVEVRIVDVVGQKAIVRNMEVGQKAIVRNMEVGQKAIVRNMDTKRYSVVKLSRFRPNSTGYRLIYNPI